MAVLTLLRSVLEAKLLPSRGGPPVAGTLLDVDDLPDGWRSGGRRTYRTGVRNRGQPWADRARSARLNAYAHGFHEGRGKLGGGSSSITAYCDSADAHAAFEFLKGSYARNPRTPITTFEAGRRALSPSSPIGDEWTGDVLEVGMLGKGVPAEQRILRWREGRYICAVSLAGEAGRFSDDDVLRLAQLQAARLNSITRATHDDS